MFRLSKIVNVFNIHIYIYILRIPPFFQSNYVYIQNIAKV